VNSRSGSRQRWIARTIALLTLMPLLTLSCKHSAIEPDTNAPFVTPPGARLTQGGDASHIGWFAYGTKIAFQSEDLIGRTGNTGIIKSVDVFTRQIKILDGTARENRNFLVAGDSVFCDQGTALGEQIFLFPWNAENISPKPIGRGQLVAVSPDHRLVATLNVTGDTLDLVSLNDNSVRQFRLQGTDYPVVFSPDSRQILCTNGRLLNIDGTWTVGPYPGNLYVLAWSWTQNGLFALSLGRREAGLDVYVLSNIYTGASAVIWRQSIDDSFMFDFEWSPDGKKIAFIRQSQPPGSPRIEYLYACDIQSGSSALIVTVLVRNVGITSFSFSPDGKQIAYSVEGDIYTSAL